MASTPLGSTLAGLLDGIRADPPADVLHSRDNDTLARVRDAIVAALPDGQVGGVRAGPWCVRVDVASGEAAGWVTCALLDVGIPKVTVFSHRRHSGRVTVKGWWSAQPPAEQERGSVTVRTGGVS